MSRLLVVSNRLPVTVHTAQGRATVTASAGGLATGLRGPFERSQGLWIGWPGSLARLDVDAREQVLAGLRDLRTVPIELTARDVRSYYEDFSNGVVWPLFHYLLDRIPMRSGKWDAYVRVNAKFADAVAAVHRPGDTVWVHDYHLMLLPGLLRERLPDARIGFFLHIPFPASEVFRLLPWRAEVLRGLLGADLIGFHTPAYARNFSSAVVRLLGHEPMFDEVVVDGRKIRFGAFPMGIDPSTFTGDAPPPDLQLRPGERLLLGVDRLDYTKGIRRRLFAVDRVLQRRPDLRGKLRVVQIAVPSREQVDAYEQFQQRVEQTVGQINGRWSTLESAPIHYLHRGFSQAELLGLYRAADVMLVTPLRDGMNLVAKEFAAARTDDDGVLVLSEFAGAADEMPEALQVNPYDVDGMAAAIEHALDMPAEERRARMTRLRARVLELDVHRWADDFLATLQRVDASPPEAPVLAPERLVDHLRGGPPGARTVLLLDYDGTLVPIAPRPEQAQPDPELLALLSDLARAPGVELHIISGRPRAELERWFGELPIGLHAEHGVFSRHHGEWRQRTRIPEALRARVQATLEQVARSTPGSLVEVKAAALAWHYRLAEPEHGAHRARELRLHLRELLAGTPLEVLPGDKVVEVRPQGVHKGLSVRELLLPGDRVLALGDDRTDEDLFAALPDDALTARVGRGTSVARWRVPDVAAARALLRAVLHPPVRSDS
ncbi:MAG: bifunctional alpha,alpha-trehalose-phosphate synthase (UDP-forming)/trehalose-phosphatase [Myxococcales bacterium]|nr:bifunctional alpha,alpha-trehalose-phosphate synthase (UDP-forming)/trehalose-phosphatase [Myxococcales bacterium]